MKSGDLGVAEGEMLGLIGRNPRGKLTLFNLITSTFRPARGTVLFDGRDITRLAPHERCKLGIARTFQWCGLPQPHGARERRHRWHLWA